MCISIFRMIQQSFIDMENMFDLLEEKQEVKDSEDAVEIEVSKGQVEFDDVHFHYDPRYRTPHPIYAPYFKQLNCINI